MYVCLVCLGGTSKVGGALYIYIYYIGGMGRTLVKLAKEEAA